MEVGTYIMESSCGFYSEGKGRPSCGRLDLLWSMTVVLGWMTRLEGDSGGRKTR